MSSSQAQRMSLHYAWYRYIHFLSHYLTMSVNTSTLTGNCSTSASKTNGTAMDHHYDSLNDTLNVVMDKEKKYDIADVTDLSEDDFQHADFSVATLAPNPYVVCREVDLKNPKELMVSSDTVTHMQMFRHPRHWVSLKKGYLVFPKTIKEQGPGSRKADQLHEDTLLTVPLLQ